MNVHDAVYRMVAEAFKIGEDSITDSTNLLEDLRASSVNYFPIINALEDEYDLDIQYQEFRRECPTVGDIVSYVEKQL